MPISFLSGRGNLHLAWMAASGKLREFLTSAVETTGGLVVFEGAIVLSHVSLPSSSSLSNTLFKDDVHPPMIRP